jgi:hypothetical protein
MKTTWGDKKPTSQLFENLACPNQAQAERQGRSPETATIAMPCPPWCRCSVSFMHLVQVVSPKILFKKVSSHIRLHRSDNTHEPDGVCTIIPDDKFSVVPSSAQQGSEFFNIVLACSLGCASDRRVTPVCVLQPSCEFYLFSGGLNHGGSFSTSMEICLKGYSEWCVDSTRLSTWQFVTATCLYILVLRSTSWLEGC